MAHVSAHFSHQRYCDLASAEVARFADLVHDVDPAVRVPTCVFWTMSDLVHHVGLFHRWADDLVANRATEDVKTKEYDDWDAAGDMPAQAEWIRAAERGLLTTLRDSDPDIPMWAWGEDQHLRFWSRRAVHETGVHRADAELALGRTPRYATEVVLDGIEEFLTNVWHAGRWRPRMVKLRGTGERIRLASTDTPDAWMVTLGAERPSWQRLVPDEDPAAQVSVRGAAADLYLMLWGRYKTSDDRFQVDGDAELLRQWQRNSAV